MMDNADAKEERIISTTKTLIPVFVLIIISQQLLVVSNVMTSKHSRVSVQFAQSKQQIQRT